MTEKDKIDIDGTIFELGRLTIIILEKLYADDGSLKEYLVTRNNNMVLTEEIMKQKPEQFTDAEKMHLNNFNIGITTAKLAWNFYIEKLEGVREGTIKHGGKVEQNQRV